MIQNIPPEMQKNGCELSISNDHSSPLNETIIIKKKTVKRINISIIHSSHNGCHTETFEEKMRNHLF